MLIVRELTGGLYFGAKGTRDDGTWFDTCEYTRPEVERIARRGFELAASRGGRADLGRQGQRDAHVTALARRRHRARRDRLPGRAPRPRARRLVRDDDRQRTGDDRRRPDREHVRRHPLGHRRRGDRWARSRSLGLPRRRRPWSLRAGARLGTADRGQGIANPAAMLRSTARCSATGSADPTTQTRSTGRSTRRSPRRRRPIWAARRRRDRSATPSCAASAFPYPLTTMPGATAVNVRRFVALRLRLYAASRRLIPRLRAG